MDRSNWKSAITKILHQAKHALSIHCVATRQRRAPPQNLLSRGLRARCIRYSKDADGETMNGRNLVSSSPIRSYMSDLRVVGHPKINTVSRLCFHRQSRNLYLDTSQKTKTENEIRLVCSRFLFKSCDSLILTNFQRPVFIVLGSGLFILTYPV